MTTPHTQGKLRVGRTITTTLVSDTDGPGVPGHDDPVYGGFMVAESIHPENARRLAACWNVLEGVPTEAIEAGLEGDQAKVAKLCFDELTRLDQLNNNLRALLTRVTQSTEWSCMEPELQDDIAKALGLSETPALPVEPPAHIGATFCKPDCKRGHHQYPDDQAKQFGGPWTCRKCGFHLPF